MNKYYEITGLLDGVTEVLYGSFVRSECVYELDAEKASWKEQGYKNIKLGSRETKDIPDPEVYADNLVSKHEFFLKHAPDFNFELDETQLLEQALSRGFVTKIDGMNDAYIVNYED